MKDVKKKLSGAAAVLIAAALIFGCEDPTKPSDVDGGTPTGGNGGLLTGGEETPTEYTLNVGDDQYPTLKEAVAWVNANKPTQDTRYTILLPGGSELLGPTTLAKADAEGVKKTVTLTDAGGANAAATVDVKKAVMQVTGAAASVQLGAETGSVKGSLFTVPEGVTLELAGRVTLRGISDNTAPLLTVAGGLEMRNSAAVTGNSNSAENGKGGGVYLTGTMKMSGEAYIGGNTAATGPGIYDDGDLSFSESAVVDSAIFLASGKTITVLDKLTPENNTQVVESAERTAVIVVEDKEAQAPIISGGFGTLEIKDTVGEAIYLADKTALEAAIGGAAAAVEEVGTSGANGADVAADAYWATEAEKTAYTSAIAAVRAVLNDNGATQAEVDAAVNALGTATAAFNTARKAGLLATETSKAALGEALSAAAEAKKGIVPSADGSDISPPNYWVTEDVMTAFESAISTAQTVYNNAAATETAVTGAKNTLTTATGTFNEAKSIGLNTTVEATLTSVKADGQYVNSTSTPRTATTELTLTFDMDISGLTAEHITVTPATEWGRVRNPVLTKGEDTGVYKLAVELLAAAGYEYHDVRNVTVSVSEVEGYSVTGGDETVRVYPWIEIADIDDFTAIVDTDMAFYNRSGWYKQTADIDFTGISTWMPIGGDDSATTDTDKLFTGVFDGGGYKIKNINLGLTTGKIFSLFGYAYRATFKNIRIAGSITNNHGIGGIASTSEECSFINCSNAANLTNNGTTGIVAGICTGLNKNQSTASAFITGCWNTGNISTPTQAGGICGNVLNNAIITGCYNTGSISSIKADGTHYIGGIGGYVNFNGTVTACYNTGAITASTSATGSVGGISGDTGDNVTFRITACYSTGALSASSATTKNIGGIAGRYRNSGFVGQVTACYWKEGTGATYGLGSVSSDTGTTKFGSEAWPATTTHTEWGIGDGSGSGTYWKRLGNWPSTYPKLWFED
jgi:hypothetical protein